MEELTARRKKVFRDVLIIAISIFIAVWGHQNNYLENLLTHASGFYFLIGVFLSGFFFASTFTVAIATSVLLIFAESHNPFLIALIGGFGALIGDSIIFKFLREDLLADFEYLEGQFGKRMARRIIHSKMIFWFAPIVAALMIASPIPDEVGLLMLASIKLKYRHFLIISLIMNTFGIFLISLFAKSF